MGRCARWGCATPAPDTVRGPVIQLRRENAAGTMYNIVGFQTNLHVPGAEAGLFDDPGAGKCGICTVRRDAPQYLPGFAPAAGCDFFRLKKEPRICFAGQMTGVEGYIESAASGILAAHAVADRLRGRNPLLPPPETMMGALCRYISDESVEDFQPMGSNMGILPPLPELIKGKQERYQAMADRAMAAMESYRKAREER